MESSKDSSRAEILIISRLLFSCQCNIKTALQLHLSMVRDIEDLFKKQFTGYYRFKIIPFFENFWLRKFEENKGEFADSLFWYSKSLPYYQNISWNKKLQALFKILVHHLPVMTTNYQDDWLHV